MKKYIVQHANYVVSAILALLITGAVGLFGEAGWWFYPYCFMGSFSFFLIGDATVNQRQDRFIRFLAYLFPFLLTGPLLYKHFLMGN